jgi:hypothetical protein
MKRLVRAAIAAFVVCPCANLSAQPACTYTGPFQETICALRAARELDRDLRPEAYFFEPSRIFLFPQGAAVSATGRQDSLAVEVEFSEPIFPYQHRTSAPDRHFGGWSWAAAFTPMYRVRIWKERSAPVRVPSFMPKGTLQVNHLEPREPGRQWGENSDGQRRFAKLTSLMVVPIGHHSNGQDGCLFADATGTPFPEDKCPPDPGPVRINRLDGSFSTNYAQFSYNRAYYRVAKPSPDEQSSARLQPGLWTDQRPAEYSLFWQAMFETTFRKDTLFGGTIEPPAGPIYGMNRFRWLVGFERFSQPHKCRARLKATVWVMFIDKHQDSADCGSGALPTETRRECASRFAWSADVSMGLGSKIDYLGLYARYYDGQDYYNLSFPYRKDVKLQAGISFTPGWRSGPSFPILSERVLQEERDLSAARWTQYRRFIRANGKTDETMAPNIAPP